MSSLVAFRIGLGAALSVACSSLAMPPNSSSIDFPGAKSTSGLGLNDSGQIVGYFQSADQEVHGYVRSAEGVFTKIDVSGANWTSVEGISNSGTLVGTFREASTHFKVVGGREHGFMRSRAGLVIKIDVPGAINTHANGINAAGQIVGSFFDARLKQSGYLRSPDGTFSRIDVPGALFTSARGINDRGEVVGYYRDAIRKEHGFLLSPRGSFITIDAAGASSTYASGINSGGQIVGNAWFGGARWRGYVRGPSGSFQFIDGSPVGISAACRLVINRNDHVYLTSRFEGCK